MNGRILPIAVATVGSACATGCGSFHHAQPLDDAEETELHAIGSRLAAHPIDVWSDGLIGSVELALRSAGVPTKSWGFDTPLSQRRGPCAILQTGPGEIHAAGLTYVTLGVFPWGGTARPTCHVEFIDADGRHRNAECVVETTYVIGWAGLAFGRLPRWESFSPGVYGFVPVGSDESRRLALAAARAIVRFAESQR